MITNSELGYRRRLFELPDRRLEIAAVSPASDWVVLVGEPGATREFRCELYPKNETRR